MQFYVSINQRGGVCQAKLHLGNLLTGWHTKKSAISLLPSGLQSGSQIPDCEFIAERQKVRHI